MTILLTFFAATTLFCAAAFVWAISSDDRAQQAAEIILQFRRDIRR